MSETLIIIDMLNDFVREDGALTCGDRVGKIIDPIARRLHQARQYGHTVIFMCDTHRRDDPEFDQFGMHAVQGTEGAQVIEELAPQDGEYVLPKRRYSAFFQSELLLALLESNATEIELTGVCTNICVMYTLRMPSAMASRCSLTPNALRRSAMMHTRSGSSRWRKFSASR